MDLVTGENHCGEIWNLNNDKQGRYQDFDQEFHIADRLEELGRRWKKSLALAEQPGDLPLRIWLEGYTKHCMPAIDRIIAEKELEFGSCGGVRLTEQDVALRRKEYRKTRTQMKKLMEKLDAVGGFLLLREDEYL